MNVAACSVRSNSLPCGDPPPPQFVRPGTTYLPIKTWLSDDTGMSPWDGVKVGDFPGWDPFNPYPYSPAHPWDPYQPTIVPIPQRMYPFVPNVPYTPESTWPLPGTMVLTGLVPTTWKFNATVSGATYSVDVPGCKPEDVKVQISSHELSAVATRHDDGRSSCHSQVFDHNLYDARGAQATVADGVLVVYVPYRAVTAAQTFQVPVTGK
jgi:hypothetical protein